ALLDAFGDFNGDGLVNGDDYSTMAENWLQSVTPYSNGDVTGDGFVALSDFHRFKTELFGGTPAAIPGLPTPEPTSLSLALLALTTWRLVGRNRTRRPEYPSRSQDRN